MNETTYVKGLNEAQKKAVLHVDGPLLIVAGAGAGKTKTITHRIAHLIATGVNPRGILALTFTNKAAGEMRSRVVNLLGGSGPTPYMTTFHALGARLLREFGEEAGVPKSFTVWDRDDSSRALKRALADLGFERMTPRQVLSAISRAKGNGQSSDEYAAEATSFYNRSIADAWAAYERLREKEGALDFSDLLLRTVQVLMKRSDVLKTLNDRWRYVTIDEYQDTNKAQFEIARLLAGESRNICAVGDLDQNIYSWNGADISNLLSFEKIFTGTNVVLLEENYRSTQTILTAANGVIEKNVRRIPKKLYTSNETGEAIQLFAGESERDEAFFIAKEVRSLLGSGVNASEIAVLFRQNFQSRALEEAFITIGLPYRVLGVRFFERAEVKDLLSYIRAARNPQNMIDFSRAAGTPTRGIGKVTLDKIGRGDPISGAAQVKVQAFRTTLARINEAINTQPTSAALLFAVKESGIEKMLSDADEDKERLGNVYELLAHATRYDDLPPPDGVTQLLEDAALMSDQDELADRKEVVSLMTIHASKGLEFDAVFVTGLEEGLFPSIRDDGESRDSEEERRLFYVALTRARKHLYLTLAASRARYGNRESAPPSSFLDDIDSRLITYAAVERLPTIELL